MVVKQEVHQIWYKDNCNRDWIAMGRVLGEKVNGMDIVGYTSVDSVKKALERLKEEGCDDKLQVRTFMLEVSTEPVEGLEPVYELWIKSPTPHPFLPEWSHTPVDFSVEVNYMDIVGCLDKEKAETVMAREQKIDPDYEFKLVTYYFRVTCCSCAYIA